MSGRRRKHFREALCFCDTYDKGPATIAAESNFVIVTFITATIKAW